MLHGGTERPPLQTEPRERRNSSGGSGKVPSIFVKNVIYIPKQLKIRQLCEQISTIWPFQVLICESLTELWPICTPGVLHGMRSPEGSSGKKIHIKPQLVP